MATSLSREVGFRARHHLWRADWDPARNRATFGALTESHPHDYRCRVTVRGPVDPVSGMLVDLALLDRLLAEEVVGPLDGRDLNAEVEPFRSGRPIPTCEALTELVWGRLAGRLPAGVTLERVTIAEDETLHADCTGPG